MPFGGSSNFGKSHKIIYSYINLSTLSTMEALAQYTFEHRLFILMLASYLALLIGGPRWLHHMVLYDMPARLWRAFISGAEQKLNRDNRTKTVRRFRGRLLFLLLFAVTLAVSIALVLAMVTTSWGWYVELAVVAYLLPLRASMLTPLDLKRALIAKDKEKIRTLAGQLPTLSDDPTDGHTAIRAAIGYSAESLPRYVIVPSLYYLVLGLPGLLLCRLLTMLADMFPIQHYRAFVGMPYLIGKLLFTIPIHLASLLMWCALLFVPHARVNGGLKAFQHQRAGAVPVKLAAYGLGYALGGAYVHDSMGHYGAWVNEDGKARLETKDLTRTLLWYAYSAAIWVLVITALAAL